MINSKRSLVVNLREEKGKMLGIGRQRVLNVSMLV